MRDLDQYYLFIFSVISLREARLFFCVTFVDSTKSSEVHLIGAVEDDHVLAQAPTHVLRRFSLSCSCWASRCGTQRHTEGLRNCDVTPGDSSCLEYEVYTTRDLHIIVLRRGVGGGFRGRARTQSPTIINYAPELSTFVIIAGVSPTEVQWKGLILEEPPF